eukprot:3723670-Pleurochrysis_carterae.AAC.2
MHARGGTAAIVCDSQKVSRRQAIKVAYLFNSARSCVRQCRPRSMQRSPARFVVVRGIQPTGIGPALKAKKRARFAQRRDANARRTPTPRTMVQTPGPTDVLAVLTLVQFV